MAWLPAFEVEDEERTGCEAAEVALWDDDAAEGEAALELVLRFRGAIVVRAVDGVRD